MIEQETNTPQTEAEQELHLVRLNRLFAVMAVSFVVVSLTLIYWGIGRTDFLNARPDNPRNIEQSFRIRRGRIVDTNEIVLAQNGGTTARQTRVYPLPIAEPIVGYYSLRHGTAGVEQALDEVLSGTQVDPWENHWRSVLNRPLVGQDVRLTIDIELQANAVQLLEGKQGAAILMSLPGGAIRAMASLPTFDPNALDENFDLLVDDEDAPLLNRAAQSGYQPGQILTPFLLAAALEEGTLDRGDLERLAEAATPDEWSVLLAERWTPRH